MKPMTNKARTFLWFAFLLIGFQAAAQETGYERRQDDIFWQKRILRKLDLTEKVNQPLVFSVLNSSAFTDYLYKAEAPKIEVYKSFPDYNAQNGMGLIVWLMWLHEKNQIVGYKPNDLDERGETYKYEDMKAEYERAIGLQAPAKPASTTGGGDEGLGDEFGFGDDDFGFGGDEDFGFGGDEFGFGDTGTGETTAAAGTDTAETKEDPETRLRNNPAEYWEYNSKILYIIEDQGFDKVTSDEFFRIRYIIMAPIGSLANDQREKQLLVAYKYDDIVEFLEQGFVLNRQNDAEHRSMREFFDLRKFNATIVAYGTNQMQTLQQGDIRNQQMIAFEHHLWSY